jgi:thiamine-phosphate pyrophosphorylase
MRLNPFYLVVNSSAWIARLAPVGLKLVQLRIKDAALPTLRAEILQAQQLCTTHNVQLIVNDHWQLALESGCDFVHLGQEDLATADVPALRKAGIKLGLSTHSVDELEHALHFDPDYIALGPIYPTALKKMPWAPQGVERLTLWKKLIGARPLVAIGGLSVERAAAAYAAGADSIAVVSDVLSNADPVGRMKTWLAQA